MSLATKQELQKQEQELRQAVEFALNFGALVLLLMTWFVNLKLIIENG